MINTVIFDMDGLMFDTERLYFKFFEEIFSDYGFEYTPELAKKITGADGQEIKKIFAEYMGLSEEQIDMRKYAGEAVRRISDYVKENGVPAKDGLYELFAYLKEHNYKIAVASSSPRKMVDFNLKSSGLLDSVSAIASGDEVEKSKPEPDIFLKAAELIGSEPNSCLVLEDSERGILAAVNAGMKVICIPDMSVPEDDKLELSEAVYESLKDVVFYLENGSKI